MKGSDTAFVHVDDDSGSSVDMDEFMLLYMYVQVKKGKVTQKI